MTGAAKFDPFAVLGESPTAATSTPSKSEDGSAKAAKVAKVEATLAGLATLAGGKSESEGVSVAYTQRPKETPPTPWDAEGWRTLYDERAAMREHDGEMSRPEAERLALDDTINKWLTQHPPEPTDDVVCVHCSNPLDDDAIPVLAGDAGHTWLHGRCHHSWLAERRRQAAEALRAMGIGAQRGMP